MPTRRLLALALVLVIGTAGCAVDVLTGDDAATDEQPVEITPATDAPPSSPLADVIEEALPSVVNVRVTSIVCDAFGGQVEGRGEGSGVVIDRRGIILTNHHVVAGAVDVKVVFNDEHGELPGTVIGSVEGSDLAVVRVRADDLDPIEVGRSSALRLGDEVVAIGFPLGLGGPTVTKGIVSATDRTITTDGSGGPVSLEGLLQTDAAINPGNSGGALIDRGGRLVGINTAAAQASAAENIGFAIAIDQALPVVEEIMNEPPEERAWLGVTIQTLASDAEALRLGLPEGTRGALIVSIAPSSPAEEGGLAQGEVIVGVGGATVESAEDLTSALAEHDPGDEVEVELVGVAGATRSVDVTLAQRPETC